jgi:hypothetical protein
MLRDIADIIVRGLRVPIVAKSPEEAGRFDNERIY